MVVYRKVDEFEDAPAINPPALFGRRSPLTAEELRTVDTIHRTGSGTKQPTVMSGWSLNDIALNNNTISRLAVRVGVEGSESDYYLNTEIISNICLRAILKQNTNYEKKISYVDSEFFLFLRPTNKIFLDYICGRSQRKGRLDGEAKKSCSQPKRIGVSS